MTVIEVVDVPPAASEDEARVLLNRPCEVNRYMLVQVLPLPNGGTRAFYRLVSSAYDKNSDERITMRANKDGKEDTALSIIRDHVEESCTKLVQRLSEAGIRRSVNWVGKKRLPMRAKGNTDSENRIWRAKCNKTVPQI
jgi:hypothetical protein